MPFPVALLASLVLSQQTPPARTPAVAPAPVAATAAEAAPAPSGASVVAEQAQPTQVCRTEPVTGSRFGRRVCRSVVQSGEDRADSREMLRQMQGARTPPVG